VGPTEVEIIRNISLRPPGLGFVTLRSELFLLVDPCCHGPLALSATKTEEKTTTMMRKLLAAGAVAWLLTAGDGAQAAVVLSFGSESWNQDNAPNIGSQLGVVDNTTRSGASFGPINNLNHTRTSSITGFIESQPGANTAVGYLSRITERAVAGVGPLETTGTRAVNLPQSANINANIIRRGIQVGWAAGTNGLAQPVLGNGLGDDFIIWESGDAGQPDALMARVRDAATQLFTDWYFFTPEEVALSIGTGRLFKFSYDLSLMGFGAGDSIDLIEMANIVSTDRIDAAGTLTPNGWVAQGRVLPEVGGAFSMTNPGPDPGPVSYGIPFGGGTYDPDPLYVSVLHDLQNFGTATAVPEPASLSLFGLGACMAAVLGAARRRREKKQ
jgi:hypothetical protein